MSKRPKRNCVFCGSTAGSKEHALPDWLAKAMGMEKEPVMPVTVNRQDGWLTEGDYRAAGKLITKRVCHDCNTGWMCNLEAVVKDLIGDWVNPKRTEMTRESLAITPEDLAILNRWLVKTACCLSLVVPRGRFEKLPPEAPSWSRLNLLPDSCKVYAAWIKEPTFAMKLAHTFRIFNGGEFHPNQKHRDSFDLVIQLNHFAIRIANLPEADWMIMGCKDSRGKDCIPNFWSYGIQPPHSHEDDCIFEKLEDFTKVCVVSTGLSTGISREEATKASKSLQRLIP